MTDFGDVWPLPITTADGEMTVAIPLVRPTGSSMAGHVQAWRVLDVTASKTSNTIYLLVPDTEHQMFMVFLLPWNTKGHSLKLQVYNPDNVTGVVNYQPNVFSISQHTHV
jgi:hypothetical protein